MDRQETHGCHDIKRRKCGTHGSHCHAGEAHEHPLVAEQVNHAQQHHHRYAVVHLQHHSPYKACQGHDDAQQLLACKAAEQKQHHKAQHQAKYRILSSKLQDFAVHGQIVGDLRQHSQTCNTQKVFLPIGRMLEALKQQEHKNGHGNGFRGLQNDGNGGNDHRRVRGLHQLH